MPRPSKRSLVGKANYLIGIARREKLAQELASLRTVSGTDDDSTHHGNEHISDSNRSGHNAQKQACLQKVTYVVKGSFHQSDRQFSTSSAGKQCSCNALVAIAFLNIYDVITPSDINKILQEGDKLYRIMRQMLLQSDNLHISELLTTKDLPTQLFMCSVLHKFKYLDSLYGRLCVGDSSCAISNLEPRHVIEPLPVIVQRAFEISHTNIMVIGNDMIALFNYGKDRCGIFDSHSRNSIGMPTDGGCAVLLYFPSLPKLVNHLYKLADSLSLEDSTVLEIKPIAVSSTMQTKSWVNSCAIELHSQDPFSQRNFPRTNTSAPIQSVSDKSKKPECRPLRKKNVPGNVTKRKGRKGRKGRPFKRSKLLKFANINYFASKTSGQTETLTHCKTKEESEILLLTRDIQKLEKYLSCRLQKTIDRLVKDPNYSRYAQLSVLTAAKIILFNKPRAREVMQLTVASFIEQSTKLDSADETLQCLSSVEKKLCERLDVVKVPDKDGKSVPILLTPRTKKAVETLTETRSLVDIDPPNPYLFAKCGNVMDSLKAIADVLNTVADDAGLLRNIRLQNHVLHMAATSTGLLQDVRLQKQVAAISQILAMQNNELDWLKSHISDTVAVDRDFSNLQASTLEVAKVVQLLHAIESGQADHCMQKTWSQLQLSDIMSTEQNMQEKDNSDVRSNANVTSISDNMQAPHVEDTSDSDVWSIVTSIVRVRQEHQEGNNADALDHAPSNAENSKAVQEGETSEVWSIIDVPSMAGYTEEPIEEKYSDVLKRATSTAVGAKEMAEENLSKVIKREIMPNKPDEEGEDQEEDKSLIRISVDLSNVYDNIYDTDELPEEKYSDVMNRDDVPNGIEDAEKVPEQKYSEVMRRNGGIEMDEDSRGSKQEYKTGHWTNEEIDALWSTLGSFITMKRVPDKLSIIIAQNQKPLLKIRRWTDIRDKVTDTIKNEGFLGYM